MLNDKAFYSLAGKSSLWEAQAIPTKFRVYILNLSDDYF